MPTDGQHSHSQPPSTAGHGAPANQTLSRVAEYWKPVFAGLGGLMLMINFWRIGYAPSLSFADVGTALGVLLLMCGIGFLAVFGLWALPLLTMHWWAEAWLLRGPPRPTPTHARLSARARAAQNRRALREQRPSQQERSALRRGFAPGSLPSFLSAGLAAMLVYVGVIFGTYHVAPERVEDMVAVVLVTFVFAVFLLSMSAEAPSLRKRLRRLRRTDGQWALLFLIYMSAWPIVLFPFLATGYDFLSKQWLMPLASVLMLPFLHWSWFVTWRVDWREVWRLRVFTLALFLLISGLPLLMIDAAMHTFSLGMLRDVDLVLTARGCDIVHAAWPERACQADHRGQSEAYRLERVDVLTRIGSDYYIAPAGGIDDDDLRRFAIPSEEVMSWVQPPKSPERTFER